MTTMIRSIFLALAVCVLAVGSAGAQGGKPHRVVVQIDQNDPAIMNLVLNNTKNVIEYYRDRHEDVQIEIVAYGPGLNMLRDDTSPVKDRIKELADANGSKLVFAACNNTKQGMEKREGHAITIIPQATIVPSGVVRVMELEEQGYSYVKP